MDYSKQYDKIYRYCYFRLKNKETAEDITQETFLRFLKHGEYQGKGNELHYLYVIARNLCIDEYRRRAVAGAQEEFVDEFIQGTVDSGGMYTSGNCLEQVFLEGNRSEWNHSERKRSEGYSFNGTDTMLETLAMKLALEKLESKERELILLRYVNEVPVTTICELEKCSRFALYRKLNQITKKLRQYLAEGGEADAT